MVKKGDIITFDTEDLENRAIVTSVINDTQYKVHWLEPNDIITESCVLDYESDIDIIITSIFQGEI